MRSTTGRLSAVDEANLVLGQVGQVNVLLVAGLRAPGGFAGNEGRPDLTALRAGLRERIAALPALHRIPLRVGRGHRIHFDEATVPGVVFARAFTEELARLAG